MRSADALGHARRQPCAHGTIGTAASASRRSVALLAHDVQRAVLDLVVDAAHVLPDHPERDQLDAAQQQDGDREGPKPGR